MLRRLRLLVMAAVVMAVMLVSSALPAFASPPNLVCPGPGEGQPGPFFGITPPGAIVACAISPMPALVTTLAHQ